jgi:hypothetical protein
MRGKCSGQGLGGQQSREERKAALEKALEDVAAVGMPQLCHRCATSGHHYCVVEGEAGLRAQGRNSPKEGGNYMGGALQHGHGFGLAQAARSFSTPCYAAL